MDNRATYDADIVGRVAAFNATRSAGLLDLEGVPVAVQLRDLERGSSALVCVPCAARAIAERGAAALDPVLTRWDASNVWDGVECEHCGALEGGRVRVTGAPGSAEWAAALARGCEALTQSIIDPAWVDLEARTRWFWLVGGTVEGVDAGFSGPDDVPTIAYRGGRWSVYSARGARLCDYLDLEAAALEYVWALFGWSGVELLDSRDGLLGTFCSTCAARAVAWSVARWLPMDDGQRLERVARDVVLYRCSGCGDWIELESVRVEGLGGSAFLELLDSLGYTGRVIRDDRGDDSAPVEIGGAVRVGWSSIEGGAGLVDPSPDYLALVEAGFSPIEAEGLEDIAGFVLESLALDSLELGGSDSDTVELVERDRVELVERLELEG